MAANPRYELTSSSPESAAFGYSSSHRPHFSSGTSGPIIEKSASFRENHEGSARIVTPGGSGQTFTSASSANSHGEVQLMSQILSIDLISSGEHKYARQLELRKATVAAMATVGEVNGNLQQKPLEQQGAEELKRIRSSLLENATRARERSRGLSEALMKLEKYAALRKWPHTETPGVERPVTSGSVERPSIAANSSANASKAINFCASPSHASTSEGNVAKPDEKIKGGVPNKRMRTSMQDVRPENRVAMPNFQRSSSGIGDRERESIKLGVVTDEKDRLAQGSNAEGWERMKTKGKRSATKLECVIATGVAESDRDHKWGAQHRTNTDNRPRSNEGHSFRSGPVHGIVSIHKSAMRNESDNVPSVGEKGDWLPFPEKDRTMLKGGTKVSQKDGGSLVIQTTVGKAKVARAPRTGSTIPINPAGGHVSRPHSAEVWDRSVASNSAAAPNRAQIPVLPANRKRPTPTRSSSPPVAQWVGQRSQKMPRIARRINVAPPVTPTGTAKEEAVSASSEADSIAVPSGVRSNLSISPVSGLVKKITSSSVLSQMKPKTERAPSPAGLSESEDSEGGDMKSKEKWRKHGDAESRFTTINQKTAPLLCTGKKSRVGKDEGGDGVRRQGRSGRAVIAVRENSVGSQVEKGESGSTNVKQLKIARPGLEKPEKNTDVKPGRPPSKKGGVGDRKGLTRLKRPVLNGSEISESDDDHEELMAAVQASINASLHACSSVFWKEMEPFFAYLTRDARESLRIQVKAKEFKEEEILLGLFTSDAAIEKNPMYLNSSDMAKVSNVTTGSEVNGAAVSLAFNNLKEEQVADVRTGGWINSRQLPLSQRLLSALIIEEDIDDACREELDPRGLSRDGSYHDPSDSEQAGLEKEQDSDSEVETRRGNKGKHNVRSKRSPYDSSHVSNGHRHWDSEFEPQISLANSELRKEEGHAAGINGLKNGDGAYHDLKLDDRIALELQSIGLYPEPVDFVVREDDQIADELKKSYIHLKEQVHINKARLSTLEKAVSSSQEAEEREREQLGMRKLLENAFTKRLGTRGGLLGVSGNKSAASRTGRASALAMAKRCVARWKHFVETGESCFTEAGLREVLLCVSSKDGETKTFLNTAEFQAGINSVGLSLMGSLELKSSGAVGTRWICHAPGTHRAGKDHSERVGEKDDMWCNRSKEREVLLEDVVASGASSVPCGNKGKRSERERDGSNVKGSSRHGLSGTIKGERKTKTKPRQKTAPLLKAVNGLLAKPNDSSERSGARVRAESSSGPGVGVQTEGGEASVDLSQLQIPLVDDLVVNGALEGQGQDLDSWLDFDDPGLPDAGGEFMGLDVPMDDLADLAMMM